MSTFSLHFFCLKDKCELLNRDGIITFEIIISKIDITAFYHIEELLLTLVVRLQRLSTIKVS